MAITLLERLNKRALVTGGAVGIGPAIARELSRQGMSVVIHYPNKSEKQAAEGTVKDMQFWQMKTLGIEGIQTFGMVEGDFSDLNTPAKVAKETLKIFGGKIDILVNNAGITLDTPLANVTPDLFTLLYNVNVGAPLMLSKALAPSMAKQGGGSIINITSIHAFGGVPGHSVYAGTKGAIVSMTQELAIELARHNIRVNAISPGGVEVERQKILNPKHDPKEFGKLVPLGRIGEPDDIAHTVLFLAHEYASYITGQTIRVDGGNTAMMAVGMPHTRNPDIPLSRQPYIGRKNQRKQKRK